MSVTKDSKNKKKKVSSSGYIAKAIPHGMIQIGTADDGTKIYSASALIVKLYFPELYKLKPGLTNYIFTGKNGKYTPVRLSDDSYDKFIDKDLLRTKNLNTQKEQKLLEVTTYSNNTPAANPYNVNDVTLKELLKKLDWFDHGRQLWLNEQDAKVRKTAPSSHPWQLAFGTVLPAAIASSFATAPLATTAGFVAFPYASLVFNDIWSNMNRPLPINGVNMTYVDGKYVDLGGFTPHQLLPKEARSKTWDEQVSLGLQKLGMSKENADAIAPFSNLGGIAGAGFASNAARPIDAAITNLARSRGYAFTPTRYNFRPTGGITRGNTTTMYPATPDYNINYTTSSTFNPKYVFSKIGETNKEGVTSAMVNAYAEAVAKGDRLTALKLLEEAYKRSGVPKSEITFDTNGNPQAWYHGTKYGNHTVFLAGKTTSTNGGLQAAELGLKRGTHLTTELESANSYADGPRDFNEIPKTLQPKTFIEKIKSKLNLFKERRLLPAERVDYTGLSLKPSRTYTTKEGPVVDYLSETNAVVYPMYVNPGINPKFMDFQGRSWANAPYNFSNDFIVSEYIKDDALRTFRDNIIYKGPDKNLAYTLFNEHPYTKDNGWKQASDIENEYFEFGNRRIQNYSPSKDYLQIELIETVVPSNINGAIHDAARNGNTALKIENIKDSHVLKNNKQYPITELITFKPELLKIADITYDPTTGKLIPLNERFNWNNPNSLYSKIGETNREGLLGGISSLKPNEAMLFGEDLVFNYLGSNRHINQIMKSGVSRQEATKIANLLYTNAARAKGELVDPKELLEPTDLGLYTRNLVKNNQLGYIYEPKYKVANDLYNEDIVTTVGHELGGHGATYSIIGKNIRKEELPVIKRYFPSYKLVAEHNIKLKPLRKPEYINGASDTKTEKLIKYLEDPEEYTAIARSYHITDSPAVLDDLYEFFTKESVNNLVNNVWSKVGDVNKEGVESVLVDGIRKLNKHVLGDEAVKMFKEYGGEPIPEGSINGEQLRRYVPEARERYGIIGDTRITDEEIALALYKHVKELGGNTSAKNLQGEPLLLFRGDTKPYTELRERVSPEKASTMGGTMDNSLGTLFLGEMPNANEGDAGILKYLNYGSYVYDPLGNIINVVWRPSLTGGASIKIGNKVYTDLFDSPNMSKEPSIANIPKGSTLVAEGAIPGTEFTEKKYKLPLSTTGAEALDINAFVVRTPSTYNMSNQMQVLGLYAALDPKYNFLWLTDEIPRAYLDKDGFPLVSYKGIDYPDLYGNEARPLWADLYRAILDNALNNNAGLLVSEPKSPFRNEHRGYTYAILPNFNIRGAKHILPYDLRIPRNWSDKNIYRILFPAGLTFIGLNSTQDDEESKIQ